jgi:hypothetical protein
MTNANACTDGGDASCCRSRTSDTRGRLLETGQQLQSNVYGRRHMVLNSTGERLDALK